MKADIRRRLEADIAAAQEPTDRVMLTELVEMLAPLGVRRQQVSAAVGALKIDAKAHGRRNGRRGSSVSADDAAKMISWLLEARRTSGD